MKFKANSFARGVLFLASATILAIPTRAQLVADGATNTLSNTTNSIPGNVTVGTNGAFTLLVLSDTCLLTNSGFSTIGANTTAKSNEVRLVSPTARWFMGASSPNFLFIGSNGAGNRLLISNGATASVNANAYLGYISESASNNQAWVTGSNSVWSSAGSIEVGFLGAGNQVVVSNGATVLANNTVLGDGTIASNNLAVVTGAGSLWNSTNVFYVGDDGSGNRLLVSEGGAVRNAYSRIGGVASSSNNLATITGGGSGWSVAGDLEVGRSGSHNQLVVSNGATVLAGNLFVGLNATAMNNNVIVDSGTLRVTNAAQSGTLDLRRGFFSVNAGLVEVDQLFVTNTGLFQFSGGTLSARNSTVTNGAAFSIGNGSQPATLFLAGNGLHTFKTFISVTVAGNAAVTGNGTIGGPTPLVFTSLSRLMPGASIGKIVLSNSPSLNGTVIMEISKSGSVPTNDVLQVAGLLTYGGSLIVTNIGTNALAAGDRFKLFDATSYGGSFSSLALPPLNPGLQWTNKLLLDGSIEVLGLIVQTLPASGVGSGNVTLNGVANPGGVNASGWFEFGFSTNYGTVTAPQALGSGMADTNFSATLTNLFSGVYHFRAVASNNFGAVFGTDQSFNFPVFTDIGAGVQPVIGSGAWGDYDNDGRLDILLAGTTDGSFSGATCQVWRNTGNGFTNINAGLQGVFAGSAVWGDYDNDGRLDILLTGDAMTNGTEFLNCQVWRNTGAGFSNINAGLPGLIRSSAVWGDYDNDGRLDILLTGETGPPLNPLTPLSQVWRNIGGGFFDINTGLTKVELGTADWGDYDNDGQLDILLTGTTNGLASGAVAQIWRNRGNGFPFTNINAGLPGVFAGSAVWRDYDYDGLLDILVTGRNTSNTPICEVWRNTGSGFTNINAGLPGVTGFADWGDYDNNGQLDIVLGGINSSNARICQLWRNTGSAFTNINAELPAVGSAAWGDYDNDGRLDLLLVGTTNGLSSGALAQIWRNRTLPVNTPPTAPTGLTATNSGNGVRLAWNAASDSQTPSSGLTYNVRAGTTSGSSDLVNAMSGNSGLRRLPQPGNAQPNQFWASFNLRFDQPVYWSVQAVDSAFAGSPFSTEASFRQNTVISPPSGLVPGDTSGDGIVSESELAAVLANLNGNGIVTQSELDLVLSNYFPNSPWLYMTNVAGLGGTNVTFALTNSFAGAFSVEFTTNLVDWYFLGPATPRYLFTDTNAPALPQRYYRLRWP